jgi:biopolymer transport protein ExbD
MTKISLTPVIDVVFILLIFFMLASNFNKVGEVNMDMTKESTTSSKEDIKIIKLLVRQEQTVLSEGKVYDDSELLSMINLAIKDASKYSIILTSKDDVTYQRFLNLISYLKTNELDNVSIGLKKMKLVTRKKREYDDDGLLP